MTLLEIVQAFAARLVAAREEFDPAVREQILGELEQDITGWLSEYEAAR